MVCLWRKWNIQMIKRTVFHLSHQQPTKLFLRKLQAIWLKSLCMHTHEYLCKCICTCKMTDTPAKAGTQWRLHVASEIRPPCIRNFTWRNLMIIGPRRKERNKSQDHLASSFNFTWQEACGRIRKVEVVFLFTNLTSACPLSEIRVVNVYVGVMCCVNGIWLCNLVPDQVDVELVTHCEIFILHMKVVNDNFVRYCSEEIHKPKPCR